VLFGSTLVDIKKISAVLLPTFSRYFVCLITFLQLLPTYSKMNDLVGIFCLFNNLLAA